MFRVNPGHGIPNPLVKVESLVRLGVRVITRLGRNLVAPLRPCRVIDPKQKVGGIATPEEDRLELSPDLAVPPVFAEDISRIVVPR